MIVRAEAGGRQLQARGLTGLLKPSAPSAHALGYTAAKGSSQSKYQGFTTGAASRAAP